MVMELLEEETLEKLGTTGDRTRRDRTRTYTPHIRYSDYATIGKGTKGRPKTSAERMDMLRDVLRLKCLSPVDCMVYAFLFRHATYRHIRTASSMELDGYVVSVSIDTIARAIGVGQDKVAQSIEKLQDESHIKSYAIRTPMAKLSCHLIISKPDKNDIRWNNVIMPSVPIPSSEKNRKGLGDKDRWKRFNSLFGRMGADDGLIYTLGLSSSLSYLFCVSIVLADYGEIELDGKYTRFWFFCSDRKELYTHMGLTSRGLRKCRELLKEKKLTYPVKPNRIFAGKGRRNMLILAVMMG